MILTDRERLTYQQGQAAATRADDVVRWGERIATVDDTIRPRVEALRRQRDTLFRVCTMALDGDRQLSAESLNDGDRP